MKKLLIVVCAVALVFGSFSAVATAGANNLAEFCKSDSFIPGVENWELFGFKNRGDCVSSLVPASICKTEIFSGIEIWELFGFKNRGDCVSWFNQ